MTYNFTNDWFKSSSAFRMWEYVLNEWKPEKIIEIGCFEGNSTSYIIEQNKWSDNSTLWAVDTWEGGMEHADINMSDVETRFDHNIKVALSKSSKRTQVVKCKTFSHRFLSSMIADYENKIDFIYIDGSHTAPDVLTDAVLAFKLCRPGGVIIFDDWHWKPPQKEFENPNNTPKVAIDNFVNIHWNKIKILNTNRMIGVDQLFIKKL
jgi:predicted O-methyltransferase YrrM